MQEDQPTIPLSIAKPIVGCLSETNTESELDALDEWLDANETNQHLFEEFIEIAFRPKRTAVQTLAI